MATPLSPHAPLATILWRAEDRTARALRAVVLVALGTGILWASAKVQVPFWPVPMTMQTFAVLVIGAAYGWRLGGVTMLAYLAEGAVGLPVFAHGGGLAYLAGPTGGYLVGYVPAAMLVGWLAERGWDRSLPRTWAAMLMGDVIVFAAGLAWLTPFLAMAKDLGGMTALQTAVASGVTPFLLGDALKIALAGTLLPVVWRGLSRQR